MAKRNNKASENHPHLNPTRCAQKRKSKLEVLTALIHIISHHAVPSQVSRGVSDAVEFVCRENKFLSLGYKVWNPTANRQRIVSSSDSEYFYFTKFLGYSEWWLNFMCFHFFLFCLKQLALTTLPSKEQLLKYVITNKNIS